MTQVVVTGTGQGFPLTNPHWTQTTLDGLGRPIKVQSGPGTGTPNPVTETDTQYGPCACSPTGKMTAVSQPFTPGSAAYWTTYTYDAIGRPVTVTAPDGASQTTYLYQGNKTTVTDPAGKWKTTTTDVQGNITQVAEPDPSNGSNTLYTNYTYDVMEHLTQVSMPRGGTTQTRTFNYNSGTHLLASETHPETGTTTYTYTSDGFTYDRLARKTDAKGQVTAYTYDGFDRVTSIKRYLSNGTEDICQRVNYTYDAYSDSNSGFQSTGAWGHVAAVATGDSSACQVTVGGYTVPQQFIQMFGYNQAGRVTAKRLELYQANGAAGFPWNYVTQWWDVANSYDAYGQVASTTYPGVAGSNQAGQTYTVGFDSMGRPNNLHDSRSFYAVLGTIYNAANQPVQTQFQYSNGFYGSGNAAFWEDRGYNNLNQLTSVSNFNDSPTAIDGALRVTYNYPATANNGQIASLTDNALGQTVSYTYDALKRLTAASASGGTAWNQSYSYDGFGNLTSKSGSGATFTNSVDQTTNRLAFGNFCYDPNGNVVSDQNGGGCGNPNYGYDVANRMVSAAVSGGTERYYYTADNKRVSTVSSAGVQTIFIYGAAGEKLAVVFGGGGSIFTGQITNNVYFAGRLIKQGTDAISGTQAYAMNPDDAFVGIDRLGSVRKTQAGVTSYLPYGEELSGTGNDAVKFATYTRDGSTGLDYADQRYYSSQFGRFMSADRFRRAASLFDSGSWNKYSYTRGDPVNRRDLHGRYDCPPDSDTSVTVCGDDPGGPEPDPGPDPGPGPTPDPGGGDPGPGGGGAPPVPCPPLPTPPSNIPGGQIAQNINAAHNFFNQLVETDASTAIYGLFGFFIGKFEQGGNWDYKSQYSYAADPNDYNNAKVFGNFNFGAVLESFGFSYKFTQSAAGTAQIFICAFGGSCGTGIPGLQYPFGDQVSDAVDIKKGFDYEAAKQANCK